MLGIIEIVEIVPITSPLLPSETALATYEHLAEHRWSRRQQRCTTAACDSRERRHWRETVLVRRDPDRPTYDIPAAERRDLGC